jgi:hypothetical protein
MIGIMQRAKLVLSGLLLAIMMAAMSACGEAPPTATPMPPTATPDSDAEIQVSLVTDPDPAKAGSVLFTLTVLDEAGKPITDADSKVHIVSDMPTMAHPPVEGDATYMGDGKWQAKGRFLMGGEWRVLVTVTRNGELLTTRDIRVDVQG